MDSTEKLCRRCSTVKSLFEFGKCKGRKATAWCLACKREEAREKRAERAAYYRAYAEAHKPQTAERSRLSYVRRSVNADWRAQRVVNSAEWRKAHPVEARLHDNRKRVRRRAWAAASGRHHTADDVRQKLSAQSGRCWWCGCALDGAYHVDHLIPLSRGGSDGPENIVVAFKTCNVRKHAKLPHEWNGRLL